MTNENDLIQKLMISKKIMDRHNEIPRASDGAASMTMPSVQTFDTPQARYNLPEEFVQESVSQPKQQQPVTQDRIMSSKLPDEIKKLMIEHPINQPNSMSGPTLSNDLIDKAARLMKTDASGKIVGESKRPTQNHVVSENNVDSGNLRSLLKEVVREVLLENNMITESVQNTNDVFSFKVGKHIFEGKVTKVKKIR
jgi:hypothetical protein